MNEGSWEGLWHIEELAQVKESMRTNQAGTCLCSEASGVMTS